MKSYTLLEVLLVIGIFAILIFFLVPVGLNFYKSQQLEATTQALIQTLRRAQLRAMSTELDSSFGVYLTGGQYILFKGDSYSTRDPLYDEVFNLAKVINVSGLSEVVFLKFEGKPRGNPAYCGGSCTPCNQFLNKTSCQKQGGCSWSAGKKICTGTCTACDGYQDQTNCQNQSGCSWKAAIQGGNIILSSDGESQTININEVGRVNLR